MHGIAPAIVTPFTEAGEVDEPALRGLVGWLEDRGIHFLVPCGSNGEAELMTLEERTRVIEAVVDEATVPVVAGTGHPGFHETMASIRAADEAGADGVLVVTPFYYNHDDDALVAYYRDVADAAPLPVYLYSMPTYTGVRLAPETVGALAGHPNVAGMKDSLGDVGEFVRTIRRVGDERFEALIGSANVLATALDHDAVGAVLALANLAPAAAVEVYERHEAEPRWAARRTADLVELNTAITTTHGIPGLKWAMRERGAPAGHPRAPFRAPADAATRELRALLADLDLV